MNTKHTPGPWHVGMNPGPMVYGSQGQQIADCRADVSEDRNERGHNARLIAAAPDLLAALQTLTDHAQETYPHFESERGQRDIAAALTAIAKAQTT